MLKMKLTGDAALKAALGRLEMVGGNAASSVKREALRQAMKIQAGAQKRAPRDKDVSLVRSAQSDVEEINPRVLLATVTFGGLAEAYAEVQHENEDFAHSEADYARKYRHPLSRTMTIRKYRSETVGSNKDGVMTVRVRNYAEARVRRRKHKITGYQGGQAHFLEGDESSAWNEASAAAFHEAIGDAISKAFETAMRKGGVD